MPVYREVKIIADMIAPCGMNCSLCHGHIRERNTCPGCHHDGDGKPQGCRTCSITRCEKRTRGKKKFCFDCDTFPCARMKQLDKRYRTKYGMSMFENLFFIQEKGIRAFVRNEKERWKCPQCGEILCVHRDECVSCNHQWTKKSYK